MRFGKLGAAAWLAACTAASAAGGPLGIDHTIGYDERGIWARRYQTGLDTA